MPSTKIPLVEKKIKELKDFQDDHGEQKMGMLKFVAELYWTEEFNEFGQEPVGYTQKKRSKLANLIRELKFHEVRRFFLSKSFVIHTLQSGTVSGGDVEHDKD